VNSRLLLPGIEHADQSAGCVVQSRAQRERKLYVFA